MISYFSDVFASTDGPTNGQCSNMTGKPLHKPMSLFYKGYKQACCNTLNQVAFFISRQPYLESTTVLSNTPQFVTVNCQHLSGHDAHHCQFRVLIKRFWLAIE